MVVLQHLRWVPNQNTRHLIALQQNLLLVVLQRIQDRPSLKQILHLVASRHIRQIPNRDTPHLIALQHSLSLVVVVVVVRQLRPLPRYLLPLQNTRLLVVVVVVFRHILLVQNLHLVVFLHLRLVPNRDTHRLISPQQSPHLVVGFQHILLVRNQHPPSLVSRHIH